MDKLARLEPYLGAETVLDTWGYPLGKAWMILKWTVEKEREHHPGKWEPFEHLGEMAVKRLELGKMNEEKAKEKKTAGTNCSPFGRSAFAEASIFAKATTDKSADFASLQSGIAPPQERRTFGKDFFCAG